MAVTDFVSAAQNGRLSQMVCLYLENEISKETLEEAFLKSCKYGQIDTTRKICNWAAYQDNQALTFPKFMSNIDKMEDAFINAVRSGNLDLLQMLFCWRPKISKSLIKIGIKNAPSMDVRNFLNRHL